MESTKSDQRAERDSAIEKLSEPASQVGVDTVPIRAKPAEISTLYKAWPKNAYVLGVNLH